MSHTVREKKKLLARFAASAVSLKPSSVP